MPVNQKLKSPENTQYLMQIVNNCVCDKKEDETEIQFHYCSVPWRFGRQARNILEWMHLCTLRRADDDYHSLYDTFFLTTANHVFIKAPRLFDS